MHLVCLGKNLNLAGGFNQCFALLREDSHVDYFSIALKPPPRTSTVFMAFIFVFDICFIPKLPNLLLMEESLLIVNSMKFSLGVWNRQAWRSLGDCLVSVKTRIPKREDEPWLCDWFHICLYVQMFNPNLEEMIQFDLRIFFRWVGSTTNWMTLGRKGSDLPMNARNSPQTTSRHQGWPEEEVSNAKKKLAGCLLYIKKLPSI